MTAITDLSTLAEGSTRKWCIGNNARPYAFAGVTREADAWRVECGWTVPEGHDDDAESCSYQPLKRPCAWVGRRRRFALADGAAAVELLGAWELAVRSRQRVGAEDCEVIGSVVREIRS